MLTAKQELFCQKIIEGMTQADAYRAAYSTKNMSDKTVWENASRIANDNKVKARLQGLRDTIAMDKVMTAQRRLEWLTERVLSEAESTSDKLKAIEIMNKMTGEYVTKVEADVKNDVVVKVELTDD